MESEHLILDLLDPLVIDETSNCFRWADRPMSTGYGMARDKNETLAHRLVYEIAVGPLEPGMTIHHICENKICVNPGHLVAMTHSEHMHLHARNPCRRCGGDDFTYRPDGKRDCRECQRQYQRDRYEVDEEYRELCKERSRRGRRK